MVFNTTKLLRYEKAHSLRSLVSAARVKTRSIVINFLYLHYNVAFTITARNDIFRS